MFLPNCQVDLTASNDILSTMRLQSAQLTEMSLSGKSSDESGCLKRMICSIGVLRASVPASSQEFLFPKISLGRGIEDFKNILELMAQDVGRSSDLSAENFPNIHQTIGRYKTI
jgi:hypothetical protein